MSFTHTVGYSWTDGVATLSKSISQTADTEMSLDISVANTVISGSEQSVAFVAALASIKALYILSDQDMTIKTNSASTPAATVALTANTPVVYIVGGNSANPFTGADVTSLKVYRPGGATGTATLKVRALLAL